MEFQGAREHGRRSAVRHRWITEAGRQERGGDQIGLHADGEPQGEHHGSRRLAYEPRGEGRERLGYLTHRVVDGGKARVILDVLVTGAEVTEKLPVLEMLFRSRFLRRLRPRSVAGDAAYGTNKNLVVMQKVGHRAYAV